MPTSTTSGPTTSVGPSTSSFVNALLGGDKWGGPTGTGTSLSFSFPWTTSGTAVFAGPAGSGSYSTLNEHAATFHYGLNATQQASARGALGAWSNVANLTFTEVAETSAGVGDIRFAWTSATTAASTGGNAWGWAHYPNSVWPSGGDVWISTNSTGYGDSNWAVGSSNFAALLHETGHALGLKHTFEGGVTLPFGIDSKQYSIMSYTQHPDSLFVRLTHNGDGSISLRSYYVVPDTPMLYDIAAIQYMYGANTAYAAGNTTYSFSPDTPFFRTIWDAGGTDTVSVSNFSRGCVIDLQEGHFSSITILSDSTDGYNWSSPPPKATYDGTNNLAIAYGAIIENAIGGSGADTLIGNAYNNSLDGGGGNDVMYGNAGNDIFDWDSSRRGGNDTFYGGTGNDIYVLNSAGDTVVENASEGTDTVWVNFSYSIQNLANIEYLGSYSTSGVTLTGNASNNLLLGSTGNDTLDGGGGNDTAQFGGKLSGYALKRSGNVCTVQARTGTEGIDTLTNIESLAFTDFTVNLAIQAKAAAAPNANVQRLVELYIAFFNRIPDAEGLAYWIDQLNLGQGINSIAETFYQAGIQYSSLTGFSSGMSNADFIHVVYRNVLGRSEGADSAGLTYWSGELAAGRATRGSLVSTILDSAHTFKGNATYGQVANLLDNKIAVGQTFAVSWGLGYTSAETSISQGMAIAAAVTATGTSQALALVGVSAADMSI